MFSSAGNASPVYGPPPISLPSKKSPCPTGNWVSFPELCRDDPQRSLAEIASAYAALFATLTTLFCCALPALLVLFGFGLATVLTFFTAIPGWETFGVYEMWYFALSGGLLAVGFYLVYFRQTSQGEVCEVPVGSNESACSTVTRWNRRILWLSLSLYTLAVVLNFWGIGWMRDQGYFNH